MKIYNILINKEIGCCTIWSSLRQAKKEEFLRGAVKNVDTFISLVLCYAHILQ